MKYVLIFLIVMVLLFQWRNRRTEKVTQVHRKSAAASGPVAMAECAQCGLHLPAADAIAGKRGVYCSAAHKLAKEP